MPMFSVLRRFFISFRGRMILAFMVAILTTFVVMAALFSTEVNTALRLDRAKQLEEATNEIVRVVVNKINSGDTDLQNDGDIATYLDYVNRTDGAYVWLVAPNGIILMDTGIPAEATEHMINIPEELKGRDIAAGELPGYGEGNRPLLAHDYIGFDSNPYGSTFTGGNYLGLFGNSRRDVWLTVIRPIFGIDGNPALVIQVHEKYDINSAVARFMFTGMRLSVSIALIIALVLIAIVSSSISKPLKALAHAANQAAMGNLSVRVPRPIRKSKPKEKTSLPAVDAPIETLDEVTVLIDTFNRMIERLDHANSDRRDFISSISHDLRTPLTSISGFVEGMLDGTIPPERHDHYLAIVRNEAMRLSNLVNEMNDAVNVDSNAVAYDFQPFKLEKMIVSVISSLESLISPKQISVQTNISEQNGIMIIGDEEQLSRVLYNLLSNAIKFTPDEGVIAIMVMRPPGAHFVEVVVEDSGPGIDEKDMDHVFERFYKGDRSRTGNQGSGLGLYIARSILQAHGQHISVSRSAIGGARFTFTLQVA